MPELRVWGLRHTEYAYYSHRRHDGGVLVHWLSESRIVTD